MKKRVTVVLEVETEDWCNYAMDDKFIENDIKTELNCASNFYNVISIHSEVTHD